MACRGRLHLVSDAAVEAERLCGDPVFVQVLWAWRHGIRVDPWYPLTFSRIAAANTNGDI
jgi:hypothetical protein